MTIAEQKPTKEEFPTAPPENLVAGSTVISNHVAFHCVDSSKPLSNHPIRNQTTPKPKHTI